MDKINFLISKYRNGTYNRSGARDRKSLLGKRDKYNYYGDLLDNLVVLIKLLIF